MVKRFSVIVAAYNAEKYVQETLWSIQRQTFPHFEVIVVDDGSTDATAHIVRQFCLSDPRFHLLQTPNRGISPARNLAAGRAQGDWIAVCDADDTWHSEKLARQAGFIRRWPPGNPLLVALGTSGHLTNEQGRQFQAVDPGMHTLDAAVSHLETGEVITLINSSVVYRRDVFHEVGGYRAGYTPAEDTDLWMRLIERGAVLNLPDRLTCYRRHGHNVSDAQYRIMMLHARRIAVNSRRRQSGLPEYSQQEFIETLQLRGDMYRHTRRHLDWDHYTALSRTHWQNGRPLLGLMYRLRSGLVDPSRSLTWLTGYLHKSGRPSSAPVSVPS